MILIDILLAVLVFGGFYLWLKSRNPKPPVPVTEEQLLAQDYSAKEESPA